jgi:hypothetical protein
MRTRTSRLLIPLALLATSLPGITFAAPKTPAAIPAVATHDGQRDFDFAIGTWDTQVKRRLKPLTGSESWVEYQGTSVCRPVWNGAANLLELVMDGPEGQHFEGLSLRLYNPESKQWTLNFSNRAGGTLFVPTVGEFRNGRGEFYNEETYNGRAIFVRFLITRVDDATYRYEQAFSADGGKTWEVNWIATDTRVAGP